MAQCYWLKIERKANEGMLLKENKSGIADEGYANWRPSDTNINNVQKGDLMIIYIHDMKRFYSAEIKNVILGEDKGNDDWVHTFILQSVNKLGDISDWKLLSQQLELTQKYKDNPKAIGGTLRCSMIKLSKDDFEKIRNYKFKD